MFKGVFMQLYTSYININFDNDLRIIMNENFKLKFLAHVELETKIYG